MKGKLSKEAKDFLIEECKSGIRYWTDELKKTAKNKCIPSAVKIMVKALEQRKVNMYKEILEFVR